MIYFGLVKAQQLTTWANTLLLFGIGELIKVHLTISVILYQTDLDVANEGNNCLKHTSLL